MRKLSFLATVSVASLLLVGCSGAGPNSADSAPADTSDAAQQAKQPATGPAAGRGEFSFAHLNSCDDVQKYVDTWTATLQPYDWNSASETDISCGWDTPPEEVTPENARSIEVRLMQSSERPDLSMLEDMPGFAWIEDDWLAEHDGLAFSMTVDIGLSAVIGTTVWVPGAEVTVSGGRWADLPELDGPAGLQVAKQLLAA